MKKTNQTAVGTSFHSTEISATVNELRQILGEPDMVENTGEDKVNFEWEMETNESDVFTVYDWKEYRAIDENELIDWHIGGHSQIVTLSAQGELKEALKSLRKQTA